MWAYHHYCGVSLFNVNRDVLFLTIYFLPFLLTTTHTCQSLKKNFLCAWPSHGPIGGCRRCNILLVGIKNFRCFSCILLDKISTFSKTIATRPMLIASNHCWRGWMIWKNYILRIKQKRKNSIDKHLYKGISDCNVRI